jgi:hypothetical protein
MLPFCGILEPEISLRGGHDRNDTQQKSAAKRFAELWKGQSQKFWLSLLQDVYEEFYVYDMNRPGGEPEKIKLADLEKEYYRLQ